MDFVGMLIIGAVLFGIALELFVDYVNGKPWWWKKW